MNTETLQPLVPFIEIPEDGTPRLTGLQCAQCSAVFTDARKHCARCTGRDCLEPTVLSSTGRLHAFTVVYRSFPEVKVPYVSAVVDLDGGGTLKGNLVGIEPDPDQITVGMAVQTIFEEVTGSEDPDARYLTYAFCPAGGAP